MCDEAVDNYPCTIKHVPYQYKSHEMCNKSVDDNLHALEFLPD